MLKLMVPAAAVVLAVLAATNPREEAHARAMVQHARQACGDGVRLLCGGLASLATLAIDYDDHLLYSTARVGEVETIGVLGQVVVVGN